MLNTEQILEQNGLNWNVNKEILYTSKLNENTGIYETKPTDYYGIVREDTGDVFATVKEAYTPTQNHTIIETMQEIAGQNDLEIVKAMPFNEGRKVMVQMKRPNNHVVIGGQDTEQYIYAINSHDGSSSLKFGFMNKVIFCQNQFGWLNSNAISGYRHTQSIQDKVKELPAIINFTSQEEKIANLQRFSDQSASPTLVNDLIDYLTNTDRLATEKDMSSRKQNMIYDIAHCIDSEMSRISHTKWGVFNGITKYTTHHKSAPLRKNGKQESIITGSAGKMNEKAFNFLKAY